jgi:hypothetical protein
MIFSGAAKRVGTVLALIIEGIIWGFLVGCKNNISGFRRSLF